MEPVRFVNTADWYAGRPPVYYDLETVLLTGQAPDRGLFVPERTFTVPPEVIRSFPGRPYADLAYAVMQPYFSGMPAADFRALIDAAYGSVQAPVRELYPRHYVLELFRNWTYAFKDFAAQLVAGAVNYYLDKRDRAAVVFVGTSGDTGPAIAQAFLGKPRALVVVLFPARGVTAQQRRQMTTLGDNVLCVEVDGDFHECQELAKGALEDPRLKGVNPTSANSINWGRFIPQAVFSYWLYSRVCTWPEPVTICIPTGNAGHIGANFLAAPGIGGLPIRHYVAPHNLNNYLVRMLEEEALEVTVHDTFDCLSNAMNVKKPNNIPRILYLFNRDLAKMRELIVPVTVDDALTAATIRRVYEETGYLLDVHGAVAVAGALQYRRQFGDEVKIGTFLTADPGKFPEKIERIIGFRPELPERLARQATLPEVNVHRLKPRDLAGLAAIAQAAYRERFTR
ncbi:MAG TPA: threonine synthase [bacterium]|nr:threonine synthase [bacterium]